MRCYTTALETYGQMKMFFFFKDWRENSQELQHFLNLKIEN